MYRKGVITISITTKLNYLIDKSGLKLSEIADKTDIPNSTLSDMLNGKRKNVSIQKVKLICDVLGCSLDYLLDDKVTDIHYGLSSNSADKYQSELISDFNKLNTEYKKFAIKQIKSILEFQNSKDKS